MKSLAALFCVLLACAGSIAEARDSHLTDAEIAQRIIDASIDAYSGACPCPYNQMRNGRACGGRSAYSRPGGYSPVCYARDVTAQDIADYRREHDQG